MPVCDVWMEIVMQMCVCVCMCINLCLWERKREREDRLEKKESNMEQEMEEKVEPTNALRRMKYAFLKWPFLSTLFCRSPKQIEVFKLYNGFGQHIRVYQWYMCL